MADPLSVAASIAGVVTTADIVFRKLHHYVKTVKNAEKEILELKSEVAALTGILHTLHLVAEELEDDNTFNNTTKIDHVTSCSAGLDRINNALPKTPFPKDQRYKNAIEKLKWPFKSTETKELRDQARGHRETLSLALAADSMIALQRCLSSQKDIIDRLDEIQVTQRVIALNEDRKLILESFLKVQPRPHYETSLKLRHAGTGTWLYENVDFQNWLNNPGSKLLLTGIPGAGKTVLSGMIIQECFVRATATEAIAYFYSDYKNVDSQNVVNIFSALAGQIALKNESSFALLKGYYNQLHPKDEMKKEPQIDELIKLIQDMALTFTNVRLILDGLDECGEAMADAAESLQELVRASHATISIAVLSRRVNAILNVLERDDTYSRINIAAHEHDIASYVQSEIEDRVRRQRLPIRSEELKALIAQELVSNAGGMFRWVACQIDDLCNLTTDAQRRKALKELPKTLEESYDRILLRVEGRNAPIVVKTLQWLAYSRPYIEVDALLEALSMDDETSVPDPEAQPAEEDLLRLCGSLIRKTNGHLELAHFTVLEYLKAIPIDHDKLSQFCFNQDAKVALGRACLNYLCLPAFDIPWTSLKDFVSLMDKHPFHRHACTGRYSYVEAEDLWDDTELTIQYQRLRKNNLVLFIIGQRPEWKELTPGDDVDEEMMLLKINELSSILSHRGE